MEVRCDVVSLKKVSSGAIGNEFLKFITNCSERDLPIVTEGRLDIFRVDGVMCDKFQSEGSVPVMNQSRPSSVKEAVKGKLIIISPSVYMLQSVSLSKHALKAIFLSENLYVGFLHMFL